MDYNQYQLFDLHGGITSFDANTGAFISYMDVAGNTTNVISYVSGNNFNIAEVQRGFTDGSGNTTIESYLYTYDNPAAGSPNLVNVLLRRQVLGGSWTNISQANYTYYSTGSSFGSAGDLQTVQTQNYTNGSWQTTGNNYYRYYLPSSSSSSSSSSCSGDQSHLLKYVVLPSSYDNMTNAGLNPLTAADGQVALYADYFFAYDACRRVITEQTNAGTFTRQFDYSQSSNGNGYNIWLFKTTEALPDGREYIIYCNYAGQPMLRVLQSGSNQWLWFYKYDADAEMLLQANPSAIIGYSEQYADLLDNIGVPLPEMHVTFCQ